MSFSDLLYREIRNDDCTFCQSVAKIFRQFQWHIRPAIYDAFTLGRPVRIFAVAYELATGRECLGYVHIHVAEALKGPDKATRVANADNVLSAVMTNALCSVTDEVAKGTHPPHFGQIVYLKNRKLAFPVTLLWQKPETPPNSPLQTMEELIEREGLATLGNCRRVLEIEVIPGELVH